jgi:hypothetical protein
MLEEASNNPCRDELLFGCTVGDAGDQLKASRFLREFHACGFL